MKKLFVLLALVGLGAFIVGCAEETKTPLPKPGMPPDMKNMPGAITGPKAGATDKAGAKDGDDMPADGDAKADDDAKPDADGDAKPDSEGDSDDKPTE